MPPGQLREAVMKMRQRVLQRFPWVKPIAKSILRRGDISPRALGGGDSLAHRLLTLVTDPYKDYLRVEGEVREQNRDLYRERMAGFLRRPRFSIVVPVYNTRLPVLMKTLASVEQQLYSEWELCLVDDCSPDEAVRAYLEKYAATHPNTRVKLRETNGGISAATNDGIALARGEFVAFLDHDDELSEDALYFLAERVNAAPDADVLYTDQDKISEDQIRYEPFFKPDWSPEYLRGVMYLGHLLAVRRSLLETAGGCDANYNGVQDFELALRVTEKARRVEHISRVCYHWRTVTGSVATDANAKPNVGRLQQEAVQAQMRRLGIPAIAESLNDRHRLRIVPTPRTEGPMVSVLICTKDAPDVIGRCLDSLYAKTRYQSFEVLVADNGTTDPRALEVLGRHPIRRFAMPEKFHFAAFNNRLAREAKGEYLLFLNNDTEVLDPAWIEHLLLYTEQPDVGAAGPLLLFPDQSVQHAGVILGPRGSADHLMRNFPATVEGYCGSLWCSHEVSAVTAACMMVSAKRFAALGGFRELFRNHYEDVDLNLRLRAQGLRNIYVASTRLIHHESKTRGKTYDYNDRMLLLDLWEDHVDRGDPYYNRNFNKESFDYTLWTRGLEA